MRLLVLAVGRSRDPLIAELVARYRSRGRWPVELIEVVPKGRVEPARRRDAEAEALLEAVPPGAVVVALDEHGELLDSPAFAARLAAWRDAGERTVAFLIGGPDGHGAAVLRAARLTLAFGRMTWPHELIRVMLVEQLYRAGTILAGHPYHRA